MASNLRWARAIVLGGVGRLLAMYHLLLTIELNSG